MYKQQHKNEQRKTQKMVTLWYLLAEFDFFEHISLGSSQHRIGASTLIEVAWPPGPV